MNIDTYNELIEKLRKNINNITINQEVDANLESLSDAWNNKFTKNCYQIMSLLLVSTASFLEVFTNKYRQIDNYHSLNSQLDTLTKKNKFWIILDFSYKNGPTTGGCCSYQLLFDCDKLWGSKSENIESLSDILKIDCVNVHLFDHDLTNLSLREAMLEIFTNLLKK